MTKAIINKQLVTVKVLKERKLFWLFEQVLVKYEKREIKISEYGNFYPRVDIFIKWISKSNLIEE